METDPRAISVSVQGEELIVGVNDGRTVTLPLSLSPRLFNASAEQRQNYRFLGKGLVIHWPDVDEDLSISGLLAEMKRRESSSILPATKQVGSFAAALPQPVAGRCAFNRSLSAIAHSSPAVPSVKRRKAPARSLRRSIPNSMKFKVESILRRQA
jgi:hypothetical protein